MYYSGLKPDSLYELCRDLHNEIVKTYPEDTYKIFHKGFADVSQHLNLMLNANNIPFQNPLFNGLTCDPNSDQISIVNVGNFVVIGSYGDELDNIVRSYIRGRNYIIVHDFSKIPTVGGIMDEKSILDYLGHLSTINMGASIDLNFSDVCAGYEYLMRIGMSNEILNSYVMRNNLDITALATAGECVISYAESSITYSVKIFTFTDGDTIDSDKTLASIARLVGYLQECYDTKMVSRCPITIAIIRGAGQIPTNFCIALGVFMMRITSLKVEAYSLSNGVLSKLELCCI